MPSTLDNPYFCPSQKRRHCHYIAGGWGRIKRAISFISFFTFFSTSVACRFSDQHRHVKRVVVVCFVSIQ